MEKGSEVANFQYNMIWYYDIIDKTRSSDKRQTVHEIKIRADLQHWSPEAMHNLEGFMVNQRWKEEPMLVVIDSIWINRCEGQVAVTWK